MKRFFDINFCQNLTIINKKLHLNLEVQTDFKVFRLGAYVAEDLRYRGHKFVFSVAAGPYAFEFQIRCNMGSY